MHNLQSRELRKELWFSMASQSNRTVSQDELRKNQKSCNWHQWQKWPPTLKMRNPRFSSQSLADEVFSEEDNRRRREKQYSWDLMAIQMSQPTMRNSSWKPNSSESKPKKECWTMLSVNNLRMQNGDHANCCRRLESNFGQFWATLETALIDDTHRRRDLHKTKSPRHTKARGWKTSQTWLRFENESYQWLTSDETSRADNWDLLGNTKSRWEALIVNKLTNVSS
jgi:hypothetical protein